MKSTSLWMIEELYETNVSLDEAFEKRSGE